MDEVQHQISLQVVLWNWNINHCACCISLTQLYQQKPHVRFLEGMELKLGTMGQWLHSAAVPKQPQVLGSFLKTNAGVFTAVSEDITSEKKKKK